MDKVFFLLKNMYAQFIIEYLLVFFIILRKSAYSNNGIFPFIKGKVLRRL